MEKENKTLYKKFSLGIILLVIFTFLLCVTTYALVYPSIKTVNTIFQTGIVDLNINDGLPVITKDDIIFEPGTLITKRFFVENNSSTNVYYRLYFDNIDGELANDITIIIKRDSKKLLETNMLDFTKKNSIAIDDELKIGEKRYLDITFIMPDNLTNESQNQCLLFNFCVEGVQTKNNPNRLFE